MNCAFTSPDHQEATALRAQGESQKKGEQERERKGRARWRELLWPHKTKLFPRVPLVAPAVHSASTPVSLLSLLSTVHYTEKLESCHRGRNHYRGSGSLLLAGSGKKKKKMGLRWWEAPDGLTDKLVNFMLGYLFIWIQSGLYLYGSCSHTIKEVVTCTGTSIKFDL